MNERSPLDFAVRTPPGLVTPKSRRESHMTSSILDAARGETS
jgi:hypothetical protein